MRYLVKQIIAAAVALAVLSAAFFILIRRDAGEERDAVTLSAHEPTDIRYLKAENENGGFEVTYSAAESGFVVDDIPSEYVDIDAFITFMTRAGSVTALKCVNERPDDPAVYGLDAPLGAARIEYSDGSALELEFGAKDPVSGNRYARERGKSAVYLMEAEQAEGFLADKTAYVTRAVTPALTVTSPLSALRDVRLEGGRLEQPVLIQAVATGDEAVKREAVSFGAVSHLVRGKGTYELDQTNGIDILGSLLDIRGREVVGYNLSDDDYAAYGFDAPYMTAAFAMADGSRHTLVLVEDDGGMLAWCSDRNVLYRIDRPAAADATYEKLIVRYFLSPLLLDVAGVTVSWGGEAHEFEYARVSNAEQYAKLDGEPLDIAAFQSFYRLLISAASDQNRLPDAKVSGEPALTVTFHYRDRNKPDDAIRYFSGSPRRLLAEVNGVCEFDIRESYAARVIQGIAKLKAGETVEEDW